MSSAKWRSFCLCLNVLTRTRDTPFLARQGELWGVYCEHFVEIYRVIVASHCILWPHLWYNPYDTRPHKSLCADSHANGVDEQVGFMYTLYCVIILFSSTRQLPFTSQVFTKLTSGLTRLYFMHLDIIIWGKGINQGIKHLTGKRVHIYEWCC